MRRKGADRDITEGNMRPRGRLHPLEKWGGRRTELVSDGSIKGKLLERRYAHIMVS